MPPTFILEDLPFKDLTEKTTKRVKKAQFGDGYMQIAEDGINPIIEEWDGSIAGLPQAEADSLMSVLLSLQHTVAVQFTKIKRSSAVPNKISALQTDGTPKYYQITSVSRSYSGAFIGEISISFRQWFF